MGLNAREIAAGALFSAIGIFFAVSTWLTLPIGRTFSMGPGYFPFALGLILTGLGIAIALTGMRKPAEAFGSIAWRGIALVMLSIVFFGVAVRGLGFAPSLFISLLLASAASARVGWKASLILSLVLTAFCVGVFIYALQLPYPIIGEWVTG